MPSVADGAAAQGSIPPCRHSRESGNPASFDQLYGSTIVRRRRRRELRFDSAILTDLAPRTAASARMIPNPPLSVLYIQTHENPEAAAAARRRGRDRFGRAPAHERQGSDGLRGAVWRRVALRQGLQGSR